MNRISKVALAPALVCLLGLNLGAQMTRQQAVASLRQVKPSEMDPTYTQAAPFAQKLVDEALAKHPEIILIGIHAEPKGHKNLIVASNFGRIGKYGDDDDMRCIHTGKPNLEVAPTGDRYEVEIALKDKAGKTVGAVGIVFNYKAGDDKAALEKIADEVGAEMQAQLPTGAALFKS